MSTRDRIPFTTRLLRPGYAREVTSLADGLRRSGVEDLPADARTAGELGFEAGQRGGADRAITRRAPRIRRVAHAGRRHVGRARAMLSELSGLDGRHAVLDGRAMTVAQVRARVAVLGAAADADRSARRLDQGGRVLRVVGVGLLLVDALALVIIFAFLLNLDWARPDPANLVTAVALALFGATVQAVLALHVGRRLWAWRHTDPDDGADEGAPPEFPPRSAAVVLGGGFLAVVSAFAAGAIYLRVQHEGTLVEAGALAGALGLLLAASALAAPWCLVADEAYAPGPGTRALHAGSRLLGKVDRRRARLERRVRGRLVRAARRLVRAEWLLAVALHRIGVAQLAVHRTVLDGRAVAWPGAVYRATDLAEAHADARAAWPDRPGCRDDARSTLPLVVPTDDRCLTLPVTQLRAALAEARADYLLVVGADRPARSDLDLVR
jgi:hypothetical protein